MDNCIFLFYFTDIRSIHGKFIISEEKCSSSSDSRRRHNQMQRTSYRTAVKTVKKAVDSGDKNAASEAFAVAQRVIDKLADKRIVHANKAARHKSRLSKAVKSMA